MPTRENDPFKFPVYDNVPISACIKIAKNIEQIINSAPKNLFPKNLQCNSTILCEIINKVQMRKVYFRVFHDCNMGEINEVALYSFWIIKFVPFYAEKQNTIELNVKIALYIFLKALNFYAVKKGKSISHIDNKKLNEIHYSFKNRDLSKEAIMLLANTIIR